MFGVALKILWDVWCCRGDSVECLVLLWRFYGMFGVALEILWDDCGAIEVL
jgi:hypothetical protein